MAAIASPLSPQVIFGSIDNLESFTQNHKHDLERTKTKASLKKATESLINIRKEIEEKVSKLDLLIHNNPEILEGAKKKLLVRIHLLPLEFFNIIAKKEIEFSMSERVKLEEQVQSHQVKIRFLLQDLVAQNQVWVDSREFLTGYTELGTKDIRTSYWENIDKITKLLQHDANSFEDVFAAHDEVFLTSLRLYTHLSAKDFCNDLEDLKALIKKVRDIYRKGFDRIDEENPILQLSNEELRERSYEQSLLPSLDLDKAIGSVVSLRSMYQLEWVYTLIQIQECFKQHRQERCIPRSDLEKFNLAEIEITTITQSEISEFGHLFYLSEMMLKNCEKDGTHKNARKGLYEFLTKLNSFYRDVGLTGLDLNKILTIAIGK